jgi:hypothetical protein
MGYYFSYIDGTCEGGHQGVYLGLCCACFLSMDWRRFIGGYLFILKLLIIIKKCYMGMVCFEARVVLERGMVILRMMHVLMCTG